LPVQKLLRVSASKNVGEDPVQASRNLAYSLIESSTQDGTAQVSQNPAYGQVETFAQDYESTIYEVVA